MRLLSDVYLVANDAFLPKPLRSRQIFGWAAVRAVLKESVAAIARHPVVRDHIARPGAEGQVRMKAVEVQGRRAGVMSAGVGPNPGSGTGRSGRMSLRA